jgi:hypothetical protein
MPLSAVMSWNRIELAGLVPDWTSDREEPVSAWDAVFGFGKFDPSATDSSDFLGS